MSIRENDKNVESCTRFGRELKVSPKSNTMIIAPGYRLKFEAEMVEVPFLIGSHEAKVLMTKETWEEFNSGEEVVIDTVKDFVKRFVK